MDLLSRLSNPVIPEYKCLHKVSSLDQQLFSCSEEFLEDSMMSKLNIFGVSHCINQSVQNGLKGQFNIYISNSMLNVKSFTLSFNGIYHIYADYISQFSCS